MATNKLNDAVYFDIDYNKDSESLILSALWDTEHIKGKWNEILELKSQQRHEVGVLYEEKAKPGAKDVSFTGFLTVLGVDDKPSEPLK